LNLRQQSQKLYELVKESHCDVVADVSRVCMWE